MQPDSSNTIGEAAEVRSRVAELFRTQREPMTRLAYVLTRDPELSDEVVQDAFLRLHANWSLVDNPAGYLRTAVVNACHSHHRHLHVVRRTPVERVGHHEMVLTGTSGDLTAALAALPFEQRAVLALRYFSDLPDDDIAAALGIRRATVRSRARRALDQLRKEITS